MSTGQAERGETFFIFNVVQPTEQNDIFSNDNPSIALQNPRDFYFIEDTPVSAANEPLVITYFATASPAPTTLGSLSTDITVIGKCVTHLMVCLLQYQAWLAVS